MAPAVLPAGAGPGLAPATASLHKQEEHQQWLAPHAPSTGRPSPGTSPATGPSRNTAPPSGSATSPSKSPTAAPAASPSSPATTASGSQPRPGSSAPRLR